MKDIKRKTYHTAQTTTSVAWASPYPCPSRFVSIPLVVAVSTQPVVFVLVFDSSNSPCEQWLTSGVVVLCDVARPCWHPETGPMND